MRGGPGTADPGRIIFTNVTLYNVLLRAYGLKSFQLSGPDWLSSHKYDLAARVPSGVSKEQCDRKLQTLLNQRFHLVLHHETKSCRALNWLSAAVHRSLNGRWSPETQLLLHQGRRKRIRMATHNSQDRVW